MYSSLRRTQDEERKLKILIKKEQFEAFHREYVSFFNNSMTNKDFHNFRLNLHNRLRDVKILNFRN